MLKLPVPKRETPMAKINLMSKSRCIKRTIALIAPPLVVHSLPATTWFFPFTQRFFPDLMGVTKAGRAILTFDDGPDPVSTPKVLQILKENNVHATFFMLGSMVEAHPNLAHAVAQAGHEIALHGYEHRNHLFRSTRTIIYDLTKAKEIVETATGVKIRYYRPPYGVISIGTLIAARKLDLKIRLWTTWGRDWRASATSESVISDLMRHGIGGSTILLHDSDCTSAPGSTWSTIGGLKKLMDFANLNKIELSPITIDQ